jgi:uncharacterized protein (TIGR00730 family)
MSGINSICVYCASSPRVDGTYAEAAAEFGRVIASRGIRLVYGGAHVGLMGAVADAVLAEGGEVLGIITRALQDREVAHQGLTELRVTETMHERKAAMSDAADAFVMLPGGFGTWDEFFEALTWTQLGIHRKPCGVLDTGGFYGPLRNLMQAAVDQRFVRPEHRDLVLFGSRPAELIDLLITWEPVSIAKWVDRSER